MMKVPKHQKLRGGIGAKKSVINSEGQKIGKDVRRYKNMKF